MIVNKNKIKRETLVLQKIYINHMDSLTNEQAGILFKALSCFADAKALPKMEPITEVIFTFMAEGIQEAWDIEDERRRKISESWVKRRNKQ